MKSTEERIEIKLTELVKRKKSFALYRFPTENEVRLIIQAEGDPLLFKNLEELSGKKGFLISPFYFGEHHPIILINSETEIRGLENIVDFLDKINFQDYPISTDILEESHVDIIDKDIEEEAYKQNFDQFIRPLKNGLIKKLVLSRSHTIKRKADHSVVKSFFRAVETYQAMMNYICFTPQCGLWIGNTPEIFLSGNQNKWATVALAGTQSISDQNTTITQNIVWDEKNKQEQEVVAKYIRNTLTIHADTITESEIYTSLAGNVAHLKTDFTFNLKDNDSIGQLLNDLYPTPAVCGYPKQEAFDFIIRNEANDRKYYSGIIGMLDPNKKTDLYVNLRCAEIGKQTITLYAGGGIMPTSVAAQEWHETNVKMQTLLNVL